MIDEKKLDELEAIEAAPQTVHFRTATEVTMWQRLRDEKREILRLARLGLWAKKHGIPAMEKMARVCPWVQAIDTPCEHCTPHKALAALLREMPHDR